MKLYLEIRPAAGGEEAETFSLELINTYMKFARKKGIAVKLISEDKTKTLRLEGKKNDLAFLFNESGTHRVQRMSKGKLHTSTVTVAVIQSATEALVQEIPSNELQISTFKSSGAGGQHVNKTESAIRIKHLPTGIVVTCQSERSQHMNKSFALEYLILKLNQMKSKESQHQMNKERKNQIGNGNRAESKRTYNFIRNEVVDHVSNQKISTKEFFQKSSLELLK